MARDSLDPNRREAPTEARERRPLPPGDVGPLIRDLYRHGEAIRSAEAERLLARLGHLQPEDRSAVDTLTRRLLNGLLHPPALRLRQAAAGGDRMVMENARFLFAIEGGP